MENYPVKNLRNQSGKLNSSRPLARRVVETHSGEYSNPPDSHGMNFKERIIMQCIICGIIMAVVLAAKVLNLSFTNSISENLTEAISDNISPEGFMDGVSNTVVKLSDIQDSIKNVFGQDQTSDQPSDQSAEDGDTNKKEETSENENITENPSPTAAQKLESNFRDVDFRIDEDILENINKQ